MNELEPIVDIRRAPNSLDLIIVRQKYKVEGSELKAVGAPTEARIGMAIRTAELEPGFTVNTDVGLVLTARVRNTGFTILEAVEVYLRLAGGEKTISFQFYPADRTKEGPMLPGEERDWFLPSLAFEKVYPLIEKAAPEDYHIVATIGDEQIGRIDGQNLRIILGHIGAVPRLHIPQNVQMLVRNLPKKERSSIQSLLDEITETDDLTKLPNVRRFVTADGDLYEFSRDNIRLVVKKVGPIVRVVDMLETEVEKEVVGKA